MAPTPTGAPRPSRATLMRRARRASRELTLQTHAYVARVARGAGLHTADVHATGVIRSAPDGHPVSPGELGRALALTPAAVTAMLDRMERAGHVRRSRSRQDARRVELEPTAQAVETGDHLFEPLVDAYERVLGRCTDDELALVARVLEELREATAAAAPRTRARR